MYGSSCRGHGGLRGLLRPREGGHLPRPSNVAGRISRLTRPPPAPCPPPRSLPSPPAPSRQVPVLSLALITAISTAGQGLVPTPAPTSLRCPQCPALAGGEGWGRAGGAGPPCVQGLHTGSSPPDCPAPQGCPHPGGRSLLDQGGRLSPDSLPLRHLPVTGGPSTHLLPKVWQPRSSSSSSQPSSLSASPCGLLQPLSSPPLAPPHPHRPPLQAN